MILQDATWKEVEAYLAERADILIPWGSTEQHGPTGPIGTDAICAGAVAGQVSEIDGVLVAPAVAFGQAQFNLDFPGTISITAATQMRLFADMVGSLAAQGFTRFYVVNGHGGNVAPIEAAVQDLHHARRGLAPIRCRLRAWWDFEPVRVLRDNLFGEWEGIHATPSEISIAQAVAAAAASTGAKPPGKAPDGLAPADPGLLRDHAGDRHFDAATHRAMFADGRVGSNPWLATRDAGRALLDAAAACVAADLAAFRDT